LPFVGGIFNGAIYPAIGFTPASAVCPFVCSGCEASAHLVRSGKSYAFLCANKTIDVTKVTYKEVDDARVSPYVLSGHGVIKPHFEWFMSCVVETLVVTPCLALLLGPIFGIRRRRRRLAARPALKAKLDDLTERARLLDEKAPSEGAYR
jgi:hypothetical protein